LKGKTQDPHKPNPSTKQTIYQQIVISDYETTKFEKQKRILFKKEGTFVQFHAELNLQNTREKCVIQYIQRL